MMTVKVTLGWIEVFPLKGVAITLESMEVFTNIPCPMCVVEELERRPFHMPQLNPRESPLVLVVDTNVHMSVLPELLYPVNCNKITCHRNREVIEVILL